MENAVLDAMKAAAPLNFESATAIAERFGLKPRSVVASAIRNGISYTKKPKVNKAGLAVVSKEDLVTSIADKLGIELATLEGLEKASKTALMVLDANIFATDEEDTE